MAKVTAMMMDTITKKSGHQMVPCAVSVCITPAAPSPIPLPYPVTASISEGITDPPMRTKFDGADICTVGSCFSKCHGNEPGTLKEVVSLNTAGPCFIILGAPTVWVELGMVGITTSPGFLNKAITVGAGSNASGAGGAGGGGGSASGSSASGPSSQSSQGPSNGSGAAGTGSNTGASAAPASARGNPEPSEETRRRAAERNVEGDAEGNAERERARRELHQHYMDNHHRTRDYDHSTDPPTPYLRHPTQREVQQNADDYDFSQPVHYHPPNPDGNDPGGFHGTTPPDADPASWPWTTTPDTVPQGD